MGDVLFGWGAGIGALCAPLCTAAVAVAAIGGTYNGAGKGFTVTITATKTKIKSIGVYCGRGAITVMSNGPSSPKVVNGKFTYNGSEQSSLTTKKLKMKVTWTLSSNGKTVSGTASTSGQCPKGSYKASKLALNGAGRSHLPETRTARGLVPPLPNPPTGTLAGRSVAVRVPRVLR